MSVEGMTAQEVYAGKLLFKEEAAALLKTNKHTITNWYYKGLFPNAFRNGPGSNSPIVIPEGDVIALQAELSGKPAGEVNEEADG